MINRFPLFNFGWFQPDFSTRLDELASLAMPEKWDYNNAPVGNGHPILFNYIHHTFNKVEAENKIIVEGEKCIFNTGLVTDNQEGIFAYFDKNKRVGATIPWFFIGWRKESYRDLLNFSFLPETADYFVNPTELIYDTRCELRVNADHIITDNITRFPEGMKTMEPYQLGNLLQGTINDAKKRVKRNYKTAIPQYFNGKLQLLLPLCLQSKGVADLALVVEKENNIYRASTILTLDMAVNNARLIAKPDDEWLRP
jgi:hypothetical protein